MPKTNKSRPNVPMRTEMVELRTNMARLAPLLTSLPMRPEVKQTMIFEVQRVIESLAHIEVLVITHQPASRQAGDQDRAEAS